jgi:hypothetical protein
MSKKHTDSEIRKRIINSMKQKATRNHSRLTTVVERIELPSPSQEEIDSPEFQAIWDVVKTWDISVGDGYEGGSGSHVKLILDALKPVLRNKRIGEILDSNDYTD